MTKLKQKNMHKAHTFPLCIWHTYSGSLISDGILAAAIWYSPSRPPWFHKPIVLSWIHAYKPIGTV